MSDLISRQDAINLLEKWADGYNYIEVETESAIKDFQHLPSAQPEIIRCKDCKHTIRYTSGGHECLTCVVNDRDVDEMWFCADGEVATVKDEDG